MAFLLSIVALAAAAAAAAAAATTTAAAAVAEAEAVANGSAAVAEVAAPGVVGTTSKGMPCIDYTLAENPGCYNNITWAMVTGQIENNTWYPEGTTTRADFQCALFLKFGNMADPVYASHGCVMPPCTEVTKDMTKINATTGLKQFRDVSNNCDKAKEEEEASMPWRGWVLIVIGVLVVVGGVVFMVMKPDKAKKKKRALAPIPAKVEPLPTYSKVMVPITTMIR